MDYAILVVIAANVAWYAFLEMKMRDVNNGVG